MNNKKYLIKTIDVYLPDKLINPDKNKIVDTLTKTGNIKKINKEKVINIKSDPNIEKPYINDGIKGELKEKEKKPKKPRKRNYEPIEVPEIPERNLSESDEAPEPPKEPEKRKIKFKKYKLPDEILNFNPDNEKKKFDDKIEKINLDKLLEMALKKIKEQYPERRDMPREIKDIYYRLIVIKQDHESYKNEKNYNPKEEEIELRKILNISTVKDRKYMEEKREEEKREEERKREEKKREEEERKERRIELTEDLLKKATKLAREQIKKNNLDKNKKNIDFYEDFQWIINITNKKNYYKERPELSYNNEEDNRSLRKFLDIPTSEDIKYFNTERKREEREEKEKKEKEKKEERRKKKEINNF
jgi:hypothetical protein